MLINHGAFKYTGITKSELFKSNNNLYVVNTLSNLQPVTVYRGGFNLNKSKRKKGMETQFWKQCRDKPWYITFTNNWDYIEQQLKVNLTSVNN